MTVLFMLLSINLDSLVTGFTYGIRRVRIPLLSAIVISAFSLFYSSLSMLAGMALSSLIPDFICRFIGSAILFIMGLFLIVNALKSKPETSVLHEENKSTLLNLVIKSLGITISIVRDPSLCDFDKSKRIDAKESLYLSFALSADAICVGLGCAMSGIIHILIPPLVGLSQLILLYTGLCVGKFMANSLNISKRLCGIISGVLLILIALAKTVK